jgi:hypothetical protein
MHNTAIGMKTNFANSDHMDARPHLDPTFQMAADPDAIIFSIYGISSSSVYGTSRCIRFIPADLYQRTFYGSIFTPFEIIVSFYL